MRFLPLQFICHAFRSEPFGLSALEALYYDIPIIVSRQSGVSEVIKHALKADFGMLKSWPILLLAL